MSLHIGTSGWAYPEWRPGFYPQGLARARYLAHYASVLGACEINATFYRLQSADTMRGWAAQVPPGFRFVVKAHRRLTHTARLGEDADFMATFLASLDPLRPALGAVLLQLPPSRRRDDPALKALMAPVAAVTPFAVEFRHESWDTPEVHVAVVAAGGTVCVSDAGGEPAGPLPGGPIGYVRLRGEHYTAQQRAAWLNHLADEARARPVYAFAKHEGVPAGDPFAGVTMAAWMAAQSG